MNKYLKNQKGFIIIPVLVWLVLGTTVLIGGFAAVKSGLVTVSLPGEEVECPEGTVKTQFGNNFECLTKPEPVLPTSLPTYIPIPTPTPAKSPSQWQAKEVTQANQNTQQPKHDGSRTGRIVKYYTLCENKDISVYENELMPYKRITGEMTYLTKGDIKCYEDQMNQLKNGASGTQNISYQPSTSSEPLVICALSYGTYQLTQASCDSFKARDKPYTTPQYYSCTLCDPIDGSCTTYNYLYQSKNECDAEQQKRSQQAEDVLIDKTASTINQHNSQVTSCRSGVGSLSNYQQSCSQYGGSAAQACRQIAGGEWQAKYNACGTLY